MYRLFDRIEKLRWKHSSSDTRFEMVKKAALSPAISGFCHIVKGSTASRVIQLFGRLNGDGQEFDPVLDYGEYLFAGNHSGNNLIVNFWRGFSLSRLFCFGERIKDLESKYPRLKYVFVIDSESIELKNFETYRYVFLKKYDSPTEVVLALESFVVKIKDCVTPTMGEGI